MVNKAISRSLWWLCALAAILLALGFMPTIAHAIDQTESTSQDNEVVILYNDESNDVEGTGKLNADEVVNESATTDVYLKAESVEPTPDPDPDPTPDPDSDTTDESDSTDSTVQPTAIPDTFDLTQFFIFGVLAVIAGCGVFCLVRALKKAGEK